MEFSRGKVKWGIAGLASLLLGDAAIAVAGEVIAPLLAFLAPAWPLIPIVFLPD